jgi:hypothetical protein
VQGQCSLPTSAPNVSRISESLNPPTPFESGSAYLSNSLF